MNSCQRLCLKLEQTSWNDTENCHCRRVTTVGEAQVVRHSGLHADLLIFTNEALSIDLSLDLLRGELDQSDMPFDKARAGVLGSS